MEFCFLWSECSLDNDSHVIKKFSWLKNWNGDKHMVLCYEPTPDAPLHTSKWESPLVLFWSPARRGLSCCQEEFFYWWVSNCFCTPALLFPRIRLIIALKYLKWYRVHGVEFTLWIMTLVMFTFCPVRVEIKTWRAAFGSSIAAA